MTPDDLETRLAGHPDSATVAAVVAELRVDPDWSLTEMDLDGWPMAIEIVHRPSGTSYTLRRRRGSALRKTEGST